MPTKSQMDITNIMFMHVIGMIGILAFTFLFISLMTSSSSRATALKEETVYYNYARRLLYSSDCLAYNIIEPYYDGQVSTIQSYSKTVPGIIDMSKVFDFNHLNCLRYDLVSGAISNDPNNKEQPFPMILYEINIYDVEEEKTFEFTSTAFQSQSFGVTKDICIPSSAYSNYPSSCLLDCDELRDYLSLSDPTTYEFEDTSLEGLENDQRLPTIVNPGVNCWEKDFQDAARIVIPYEGLNCSSIKAGTFGDYDYGNVFETNLQYFTKLRYPLKDNSYIENEAIVNIKFCVINIPTFCDPFYEGVQESSALNQLFTNLGINTETIYDKELCESLGLVTI